MTRRVIPAQGGIQVGWKKARHDKLGPGLCRGDER